MDGVIHLVQMTATYSNAVLVAILPHITDVAQKLELPVATPITQSEIRRYFCDPQVGEIGGFVVLTNGYQFWYGKGHVRMFHSPRDYFVLQNPDLIPKLYGPLNMDGQEAVALARQSLSKLGYTNDLLYTTEPDVKLATPEKAFANKKGVPQYEIVWHDPSLSYRRPFDELAKVDVNAEVKHVDGFVLNNKQFWKPNPEVSVVPTPQTESGQPSQFVGGHQLTPVSAAYSDACLSVLLPQISDYARRLQLPISLPISAQACSNIDCSLENGQPNLQIILNNGYRFNYRHGYVVDFYAGDNYFTGDLYGQPVVDKSDLYQSQPVSKNELIEIARQGVRRLGYSEQELHMAGPPDMVTVPDDTKTSYFTRYEIAWDFLTLPSGIEGYRVQIEVDAKTKSVKSVFLDNTNLWREPPKIDESVKPPTQ